MTDLEGVDLVADVNQDCALVISTSSSELISTIDDQTSELQTDTELQKVVVPDNCVVIFNGQRCQLKVNPETGVLVAYPIEETKMHDKPVTKNMVIESNEEEGNIVIESKRDPTTAPSLIETNMNNIEEHAMNEEKSTSQIINNNGNTATTHQMIITSKVVEQLPPTPNHAFITLPKMTHKYAQSQTQPNETHIVISKPRSLLSSNLTSDIKPTVHHDISEPVLGVKITQSDLDKLKCQTCDFQAFYSLQLDEHVKREHSSLIHNCKCCLYFTLNEEMLQQHYTTTHPKNICSECNLVSEHVYIINRHKHRHSNGCVCDMCGKTYKDKYILQMHIKMVHSPADVLFECSICKKSFNRKAHLNRHIRTHNTEKPYKCPHCDYRGGERSDITKHVVIHKPPQYSCEFCGKSFRHVKNRDLHVKRHAGQRDYKCGVCEFFGYTFTDIRKHIERRHTDIKSFICEKCGSTFKTEAAFTEHQLTWHQNEPSAVTATSASSELDSMINTQTEVTDKLHEHLYASNADPNESSTVTSTDIEIMQLGDVNDIQ